MALPLATQADIDAQLQSAPRLVVKFSAAWCGPCRSFAPTVEAAAAQHPDVTFVEVDLDKEPGLAARWRVRSLPTVIGFKQGQVAFQFHGAVGSGELEKHLAQL